MIEDVCKIAAQESSEGITFDFHEEIFEFWE